MIVPLVAQKLVKVAFVVEELAKVDRLAKVEFPDTVKSPPKYTLPEEWTDKSEPGLVVPTPTLPFPSIVRRVFVPTAVDDAILNLLASAVSIPIVQPDWPLLTLDLTVNPRAGVVVAVSVNKLFGVVVPMPKL